ARPVTPGRVERVGSGRFVKVETGPLCAVTVSLQRVSRRDASAAVVSVDLAYGLPPCGAMLGTPELGTTERATTTAVSTDPDTWDPAIGLRVDVPPTPAGIVACTMTGPVVPAGVSATR